MQYYTVQYYTVQYYTVQYCTVQYYTVQYYTVQYYTVQYYTVCWECIMHCMYADKRAEQQSFSSSVRISVFALCCNHILYTVHTTVLMSVAAVISSFMYICTTSTPCLPPPPPTPCSLEVRCTSVTSTVTAK